MEAKQKEKKYRYPESVAYCVFSHSKASSLNNNIASVSEEESDNSNRTVMLVF